MQFKIDTSEKFHAITIKEPVLSANMTEELDACLMPFLQQEVKNVVLNLQDTQNIDNAAGEHLVEDRREYRGADRPADPLGGLQRAACRAGHLHGYRLQSQGDVG